MLDVCHSKVETELEFVVQGDRIVHPVFRFVIGAAFAFQNAGLTIAGPLIPPIKIGQSIGVVCVLIQPLVVVDVVAAFLCIPVCRYRFEQMPHLQLVCIVFRLGLHAPLFDHPQLQRGRPRRHAEYGCHIASADGVGDIALGAMHTAFQPAVIAHSGGVAK